MRDATIGRGLGRSGGVGHSIAFAVSLVVVVLVVGLLAVGVRPVWAAVDDDRIEIVLFGDSYSAGNGAGFYWPNDSSCHRSHANWAELYASSLRVPAHLDNCPNHYNPGQSDYDGDGIGDACDPSPGFEVFFQRSKPDVVHYKAGSAHGDPHLVTFDGLKYELQTVGEHVLVESADESVRVQIRNEAWFGSTKVSVVSVVVAQLTDYPVEIRKGGVVLIDGEPVELASGEWVPLIDNAALFRSGNVYTLAWPGEEDTDRFRVDVTVKPNHLTVKPFLPPHMAGQVSGLLGDGDGDHTNDLALRGGTVLTQPLSKSALYTSFANSWRITQAESLFEYGPGESTLTYTNLAFPSGVPTVANLDPQARALGEAACWAAGITDPIIWEACVLDVGLTGETEFADSAIGVPTPLAAMTGSYFHDFEDGTAPGWSVPLVTWADCGVCAVVEAVPQERPPR